MLCKSALKGMICRDEIGVGKTLLAILALSLVQNDPEFSLVVAPKSVCAQWVSQIEAAWMRSVALLIGSVDLYRC